MASPPRLNVLLQRVKVKVGWGEDDLQKPYAELVTYRRVIPEDLKSPTWVDLIAPDGKPLRRNIGLLRYCGRVKFAEGEWAGIELQDSFIEGNENDGSVEAVRYFRCPGGRGLFVSEKWVRRSFMQRPRTGQGHGTYPTLSDALGIEPCALHSAGIVDVTQARRVVRSSKKVEKGMVCHTRRIRSGFKHPSGDMAAWAPYRSVTAKAASNKRSQASRTDLGGAAMMVQDQQDKQHHMQRFISTPKHEQKAVQPPRQQQQRTPQSRLPQPRQRQQQQQQQQHYQQQQQRQQQPSLPDVEQVLPSAQYASLSHLPKVEQPQTVRRAVIEAGDAALYFDLALQYLGTYVAQEEPAEQHTEPRCVTSGIGFLQQHGVWAV